MKYGIYYEKEKKKIYCFCTLEKKQTLKILMKSSFEIHIKQRTQML